MRIAIASTAGPSDDTAMALHKANRQGMLPFFMVLCRNAGSERQMAS